MAISDIGFFSRRAAVGGGAGRLAERLGRAAAPRAHRDAETLHRRLHDALAARRQADAAQGALSVELARAVAALKASQYAAAELETLFVDADRAAERARREAAQARAERDAAVAEAARLRALVDDESAYPRRPSTPAEALDWAQAVFPGRLRFSEEVRQACAAGEGAPLKPMVTGLELLALGFFAWRAEEGAVGVDAGRRRFERDAAEKAFRLGVAGGMLTTGGRPEAGPGPIARSRAPTAAFGGATIPMRWRLQHGRPHRRSGPFEIAFAWREETQQVLVGRLGRRLDAGATA